MSDLDEEGLHAPDLFTERLLQVQLADFWKGLGPRPGADDPYDPLVAEERYTRLQNEFINKLPPPFALRNPNCEWDKQQPHLAMQRQLLYITTFESICQNFRSLLLLRPEQIRDLPAYKQVLVRSQSRALAHAALSELKAVSALHGMLGASYTRYTSVIVPTFEASVLLVCMCINGLLDGLDGADDLQPPVTLIRESSSGIGASIRLSQCLQAAERALGCLQMLAEVSVVAEVGARNLAQLLQRVPSPTTDEAMIPDLRQEQCFIPEMPWPGRQGENSGSSVSSYFNPDLLPVDGWQPGLLRDVFAGEGEQSQPFMNQDPYIHTYIPR